MDDDRPLGIMTRQGEMLEGVKEQITSQFGSRFQRIEEAVAAIAENTAALTQQVQTHITNGKNKNTEEINIQHLQQPPILDQVMSRPSTSRASDDSHSHESGEQDSRRETQHTSSAAASSGPTHNAWLLSKMAAPTNLLPGRSLPMSTRDLPYDPEVGEQVKHILETTATHLSTENSKPGFFPHKYIFRGPDKHRATINSLSLQEHLWAIFRMLRDDRVPAADKPFLHSHIEEILEDTRDYEWDSAVRKWSDEIFSLVSEGRLKWDQVSKIQLLRMSMARPSTARRSISRDNTKDIPFRVRQQTQSQPEILKGGPPCVQFNTPNGCSLPSGHILNGRRLLHICAYCLMQTASANPHSEVVCRNKIRHAAGNHFQ